MLAVIMVITMPLNSFASVINYDNLNKLISNEDELSKEMKKYAKQIVSDNLNLLADEVVDGHVVKIFKTDVDNQFVCFTDAKVEIVAINGKDVVINGKNHKFDVVVRSKELSEPEISTRAVGGTSYVVIPDPGGSWNYLQDYWIDVYANKNFGTFTIAALAVLLGNYITGVPATIALAFSAWLTGSVLAPYTSVAHIHGYKYSSLTFFKTYKYYYYLYAEHEGNNIILGNKKWFEAWAGL